MARRMKIAIWSTEHVIANTVARACHDGFGGNLFDSSMINANIIAYHDVHIGYGILRNMDTVWRECERYKKPFFHIDNGYFNPSHYSGYYRISYKGTQARYDADFKPLHNYSAQLHNYSSTGDYVLICPPTNDVCRYFGVIYDEWCKFATHEAEKNGFKWVIRNKGNPAPLAEMLDSARAVITYNSSVGWQALQQGIPCLSDVQNSVVGSYYATNSLADVITLHNTLPREPLFNFMRAHQFTLEEIRQGKAWCIIKHYLSTSDGIQGKQWQQTFAHTA